MKNKIICLVGVSCSGKTTWAKNYMSENKGTYYVSRDAERESIFSDYHMGTKLEEDQITKIVYNKISNLLRLGTVIVDNTNLDIRYINELVSRFPNTDITFQVIPLPDKETLIKRNQKRYLETGKLIPERVLHKQLKMFEELDVPKNISHEGKKTDPRVKERDSTLVDLDSKVCCIFDLDGTLSLMNNRSPYNGEDCINDEPDFIVALMMNRAYAAGDKVFIFSGRNSDNGGREATEEWLKKYGFDRFYDELIMRKPGDERSDTTIKREMYNEHIKDKYVCLYAFDDRDCVVDLWRSMGIQTFQCYYGNF